MKDRIAFQFYRSYYDTLKEIHEDGDKLIFLLAILDKQFEDKEPQLEGIPKLCYASQKYNIDKQVEGYKNKTKGKNYPTEDPSVGPWEGPNLQEKEKEKEKEQEKEEGGVGLLFDSSMEEFYKFVKFFPQGKGNYNSDSVEIWNTLAKRDKDICLQLTPIYIEYQLKLGKEIYIKNVNKFLEEGFHKQLNEFQSRYLGRKVILEGTDFNEREKLKRQELKKKLWGY